MHVHRLPFAASALLAISLPIALPSALLGQANVTTVPCSADTTLYQDATGSLANGAGNSLFAGVIQSGLARRTLVKFDVAAAVPAGARVFAVELRMNITQSVVAAPVTMTLHRVSIDWSEGTADAGGLQGQGTAAGPGDTTWLHRNYPSLLWTAPGGDYDSLPHGSAATPQTGPVSWQATSAMAADVQSWLDAPPGNFGWLVRTDELVPQQIRRFDSRSSANVAGRPVLVVSWLVPGTATAVGTGCGSPAPTLAAGGTLLLGGSLVWTLQGPPGLLCANVLATALQLPPVPIAPGCASWLPPGGVTPGLHMLDALGQAVDALPIPNVPAFTGLPVAAQCAMLDPSQPLGFAVSNAALAVVL
jgi:hypothetical protein